MRIYITTDLEGISGVVQADYTEADSPYYPAARQLLMGDTNAAIAGCFDAGADEVLVGDGHHRGNNFIQQALDPRAILDMVRDPWIGRLDASFDATMFIGTHAMAGTLDGFLDHTMSPESWFEYSINRKPLGEIGMWATMAGHHRVPLVYVSGDEAACREAKALIPGIVTTAVKKGAGRNNAMGLHPEQAHLAIRRDAARAVSKLSTRRPRPLTWRKPLTVRLTFCRSDMADFTRAGVKRVDGRTVCKKVTNQLDILI